MVWFRLYFLSGERITSFNEFEAADDSDALRLATELAAGADVELWSGKRKVARLQESEPVPARPVAG